MFSTSPPSKNLIRFPPPLSFSFNEFDPADTGAVDDGAVELEWVDLNVRENCKAHHTDDYDITERMFNPHLVLRRGQPFQIDLQFYRIFYERCDVLVFCFELGDMPSESKNTRVRLSVKEGFAERGWIIESVAIDQRRMRVRISSPPTTSVGQWSLTIQSSHRSDDGVYSESDCPIRGLYIICNPWCIEDSVFMGNAVERDEYVLNDVGTIWRGTHNAVKPTVWSYGQYEEGVLEACLYVLDRSKLRYAARASPIDISRTIAQMVNSVDDSGVLQGEWKEEKFVDGTPPTRWTGSASILRQYHQFGGKPVKYAQCWVFAGVVTSMLRCLGIPSRVVTNYSSAHDTDSSCTVDIHFSEEDGKLLKKYNADSVWNFHVWNDCWFKRPDLPPGYDGWQAVDATPQERSDGLYRVGPASVKAVKAGHIYYKYDTPFLFAEVNADKLYWLVNDRKVANLNEIRNNEIGRMIITKRPGRHLLPGGDEDRMDVTEEYKHSEMSPEERASVMNALLNGNAHILKAYQRVTDETDGGTKADDVHFDLDLRRSAMIGAAFTATLWVTNNCDDSSPLSKDRGERHVRVNLRASAQSYTGAQGKKVKATVRELRVAPRETVGVDLRLSGYDYLEFVGDQATLLFTAMALVEQTNQVFTATDDFRFQLPHVRIETVGTEPPTAHRKLQVRLSVRNPLPKTLTECHFAIEGPGLTLSRQVPCEDAPSRTDVVANCTMRPWKPGRRTLVATFSSKQLNNIDGLLQLTVLP